MKPSQDLLDRLFRAAARPDHAPNDTPPLGLESRVLAEWRSRAGRDGLRFDPLGIVRVALGCALALVVVVGALEYDSLTHEADPATDIANGAFLTALNR